MINYTHNSISYVELTILFPECSIKFDTMQQIGFTVPLMFLNFNKIVNIVEYDLLPSADFSNKCCGFLFFPDSSKLTDQQKAASDNLMLNLMSSEYFMAETVDEKAEFIYLIANKNMNFMQGQYMPQTSFSIFRFRYEELWTNPQAINLMKTLHCNNMLVSKQLLDLKNYFSIYRQHFANWSMALFNKEMMYDELYKKLRAKKKKEKAKKSDLQPQICVLCCRAAKNVVFLPCGHISVCKECAVEDLNLELFKVFYKKANTVNCLVCRKPVKEAREVFL